ncbi:MAG: hypothetical protein KF690_09480 [Bacteroidetes bacterium]|nr:hypothetical protein [Bacteroidota bacterium]
MSTLLSILLLLPLFTFADTDSEGENRAPKRHQVAAWFFADWVGRYEKPVHYQGQMLAYEVLDVQMVQGQLVMQSYLEYTGARHPVPKALRELYLLTYDRESRTGRYISHAKGTDARPYAPIYYYFLISNDGKQFSIKETDPDGQTTGSLLTYQRRDF